METPDQSKLIQIFSDGPSVDLTFLSITNEQHDERDHLPLIDIGTYSLHTIHGNLKNSYFFRVENGLCFKMDMEFTLKSSQKRDL